MVSIQTLLDDLIPRQAQMVDELGGYVSLESGSRDKTGVDAVGETVAKRFAELEFSLERIAEPECGDHLIARRAGSGRGRLLVLIHLDTVWPRGTLAENPFRVDDGKAFGPGVLDMKGGWVVLLEALRALDRLAWDGLAETVVFMTGDEELGSPRGREHIERLAREADWALVMEPARENGDLVSRRGMVGAVYLTVHGITAHAANHPERGASAITEAAHKVLALEALTDRERGVLVSVGTIAGGAARQVVPDRVELSVDLRAPSPELAEELMVKLRRVVEDRHVPGTDTEMRGGITRPATQTTPGGEALLTLAQRLGRDLGLDLHGLTARAGSDGNFTGALGVPTLDGLGPQGANGCARDEYVLVDTLPVRAALLAGLISELPEQGGRGT